MGIDLEPKESTDAIESLGLSFELATLADVDDLLEFEQVDEVDNDSSQYSEALKNRQEIYELVEENKCYLIKNAGRIIGTAAYKVRSDNAVYIRNIYIAREYRAKGIARAALVRLIAMNKGAKIFTLLTNPKNIVAIALYKQLGFKYAGSITMTFPNRTFNATEIALKMTKRVR